MKFEWNEEKNRLNIRKHGLDFFDAHKIFESPMLMNQDNRKDYGEDRFIGAGYINGRAMIIVFTKREPNTIRIISLRKANKREQTKLKTVLKD